MNDFDKSIFTSNWPTFRGFFQNKWELMTEEDFEAAEGDVNKLMKRWEDRYGQKRDQFYASLYEIQDKFR